MSAVDEELNCQTGMVSLWSVLRAEKSPEDSARLALRAGTNRFSSFLPGAAGQAARGCTCRPSLTQACPGNVSAPAFGHSHHR